MKVRTTRKRILLVLVIIFGLNNLANAQPEKNYMDLLVYYVDGDYEKCLKKADKYMGKDETKYDALPYLYTSMSFYEMSRDHKYSEDYPKSYRQSLNYLSKYRKKDKTYAFRKDAEPFIEKMKMEIAEQVDNYKLDGTEKAYRKSKSLLKKVVRIDPDDIGAQLMLGVHYINAKDKSQGKKEIKESLKRLAYIGDSIQFSDMTFSQQYYFKESLIEYYYYKSEMYPNEAEEVFLKGNDYFRKDREDLLIENITDYRKLAKELEG